jgi:hypothetical protein
MEWTVEGGALFLGEEGGGGGGGYVARFSGRDGAKVGDSTSRNEGRLEIMRPGLTRAQFEEVFVTLIAEMERKRMSKEELEVAGEVVGAMAG